MTDEKRPDHDGDDPLGRDGLAPRGEDLAATGTPRTEPYEVVDPEAEELTEASDVVDDTPDKGDPEDMVVDSPDQLAEAEAAARAARSSRPVRKSRPTSKAGDEGEGAVGGPKAPRRQITRAPVRRDRSKGHDEAAAKRRTTPAMFARQSVGELKKVKWPTGDEMRQYFIVVLVFVLLIIAYVGGLDVLFGWGLIKLFGQ